MARAYSIDLRERVLDVLTSGEVSQAEVARRFQVSETTVSDWRKQEREEGRRRPKGHGGGVVMLRGDLDILNKLAAEHNDITLAEYAVKLKDRTGRLHSRPALCRALKRLGWKRKKRASTPVNKSAKMWRRLGFPGMPTKPNSATKI